MKRRDSFVIWLDYFNSRLSRGKGRRVPVSLAARGIGLEDLARAARGAGLDVVASKAARHPKRPREASGYVQVLKKPGLTKQKIIKEIAKALMRNRPS